MADDDIAGAVPCIRCSRDALLNLAGRCADCIGDMRLRNVEEHAAWRAELAELVRSGELAGA
ncbi:hypothetical protein [Pseudonocardia sp. N23]|uniref:hypothetical protein n=1 Tax=Pseudonocardia sp. N23 TaxID=1987376 RepID=UPI000BFDD86B|nr:hypothetical protein [Pseudonocardia sp. N23]GAY09763.1 hypothetical protein TOK_4116 [Pseudonocardia sp. N23]